MRCCQSEPEPIGLDRPEACISFFKVLYLPKVVTDTYDQRPTWAVGYDYTWYYVYG